MKKSKILIILVILILINVFWVKPQYAANNIEIKYDYNENLNRVTAKIISNVELKNTKPTWSLGNDKKTYTKVYTQNESYSTRVEDIYGRVTYINININQIKKFSVSMSYEYNSSKTQATAKIKSNVELKNTKPTWTLSSDKKTYTKIYTKNESYSTRVEDINGNVLYTNITINQIKKADIQIRYEYNEKLNNVTAKILSDIELKNTKPTWTLSSDKKTYTKIYTKNESYDTKVEDINGNIITIYVNINQIKQDQVLLGIDVSAHQGIIEWQKVKNAGIQFVIIRCGYGENLQSQDDKYFLRNVTECERLGIPYGVYLYSYALTEKNAYSEAQHVLRLINGHKVELGAWIDMEDADTYKQRKGMPSNDMLAKICSIFCDTIQANNYKAGIYANLDWLTTKLNSSSLDKYDKWVAEWNSVCKYNKKYVMWQYTENGVVNGIEGKVDMDRLYK